MSPQGERTIQQPLTVCHLGRVAYEPAWTLQKQVQAALIAAKRQDPPRTPPHVLLLVEHPSVYTLGKSGNAANLLWSNEALTARGAHFVQTDRGGDITYHGPGQLVGYPVLDLDRFYTDIHRYMRDLETVVLRTCADYGLQAGRIAGRTGVWIDTDTPGAERKICAFGIRCSRWVTMHGFAFNLNTDLSFFSAIIPCGIRDRGVTSLARERGGPIDEARVRTHVLRHFADCFGARLAVREGEAAFRFLEDLLGVKDLQRQLQAPFPAEPKQSLDRAYA